MARKKTIRRELSLSERIAAAETYANENSLNFRLMGKERTNRFVAAVIKGFDQELAENPGQKPRHKYVLNIVRAEDAKATFIPVWLLTPLLSWLVGIILDWLWNNWNETPKSEAD